MKKNTPASHNAKKMSKKRIVFHISKSIFWFSIGAALGLFFFISFLFIFFEKRYENKVYPGITASGIEIGGKTKEEVQKLFTTKNEKINDISITLQSPTAVATTSAKNLQIGYNTDLIAHQAYTIGRSDNPLSNLTLILQTYLYGIDLPQTYSYSNPKLEDLLNPIAQQEKIEPVDALFQFENGRVVSFRPSSDGQEIDRLSVENDLQRRIPKLFASSPPKHLVITIPIKVLKPQVTTDQANNLGVKELIASGTSLFQNSIESRIFNINLATSRINGVLIPPGETFSFAKAIGDISAFTGYKQAYVIQNGRTVLGDGGGVCQVSTTLFRAALNAGLPIVERHAHAYRVGYYEQDSPPGVDATVYVPSVDFKFKNDTNHHVLIQAVFDPSVQRLTFFFYGTKDNREVTLSKPVITSQTPAPPPSYQDDPTLPKGVEKQVEHAAPGASVYFTRQVSKDGKVVILDKFVSNFRPWQAVFLRGTKE